MLSSHDRSFFPRGELLVEQVDTSFRFRCFILFFSSFSDFWHNYEKLTLPAVGMGDGLAAGMPVSQPISTIAFRKMI